jgi:hypothetical protein
MLEQPAMTTRSYGLAVFGGVLLAACAGAPSEETAAESAQAPLVQDASSMIQRSDGRWDVVCKDGRREVVTTSQVLANDVCQTTSPDRCVRKCSARFSDGTCRTFDADFCGPGATCVARVTARFSDGTPREYTADFCNAGPAECGVRCSSRFSDGTCRTYDADFCGATAGRCVTRCSSRFSDGTCRTYEADFCKEGLPAPACLVNCTSRFSDGTCRTYGADICR